MRLSDLNKAAECMTETDAFASYMKRHAVDAQPFLTVHDDEAASLIADHLAPMITGKVVVEIGGGLGLAAFHMGSYAKRVYSIEANPMWASTFVAALYRQKPKNVSYLFGAASEFAELIKADVAVFLTHSGVDDMAREASKFAPIVVDVYGELIDANPDGFDAFASLARKFA